ncbi:MAG: DUF4349 domain-containing protein [Alphaproteobacteria bacterium]|nr:DUF4349 domain-containing protein [Alphaproteobacteria bacterium]
MRTVITAALMALALAGCSRDMKTATTEESAMVAADAVYAPQMAQASGGEAARMEDAPPASPPAPGQPSGPVVGASPMLAYVYGVGLEVPARNVRGVMGTHEQACRTAGPRVCQVINSSVNAQGDDAVYGQITLRAEPRWLETFRKGLEGQAKEAGGRVREENVSSEDLTRQIVDTSAHLNAQKTLRDRLQQILRSRPGKLSELLETERELARVQGEIDSAESQLAVMRERVAMSILNLNYASRPSAVTGGAFEPVTDALTEFFSIVMLGVGVIIRLIAVAIPVALVLVPLGWLALRWRRARRAKKLAAELS